MAEPLTPEVADLVERVSARVARAATADEIRATASRAAREARDSTMGIGEIRDLMNVAIDRARQVEALASRLADLVSEARDGT